VNFGQRHIEWNTQYLPKHTETNHVEKMIFVGDTLHMHRILLLVLETIDRRIHVVVAAPSITFDEIYHPLPDHQESSFHTCMHGTEEYIPPLDDPHEGTDAKCNCSF
jgi:hypothetical protein